MKEGEKRLSRLEALEVEREKLHQLINDGSCKEAIQKQSEVLDGYIVDFYSKEKEGEIYGNYLK